MDGDRGDVVVAFVEDDQMKFGRRVVVDRSVDGAVGIVGRSRGDLGRAKFPGHAVIVKEKAEGRGDVRRVVVHLPPGREVHALFSKNAEDIRLGEPTRDVAFATKIILGKTKLRSGIERGDRGLQLRDKRQEIRIPGADPAVLNKAGIPERARSLNASFVAIGVLPRRGSAHAETAALRFAVVVDIEHIEQTNIGGVGSLFHLVEKVIDEPAVTAFRFLGRPIARALKIVVAAKTVAHKTKGFGRAVDALDRLRQIDAARNEFSTRRRHRMDARVRRKPKVWFVIEVVTFDAIHRSCTAVFIDEQVQEFIGVNSAVSRVGRKRKR